MARRRLRERIIVNLFVPLVALFCLPAFALDFSFHGLDQTTRGGESYRIRVGVAKPEGPAKADILYIHGFGDRLDNHEPLFVSFVNAGFRVISFDLPAHGESQGDLNNFNFEDLGHVAVEVEKATYEEHRPLILSGLGIGGLIAVRMIQRGWSTQMSRPVSAAILFSPAIAIRKAPWSFGDGFGSVSEETLTHDPSPPHKGRPSPSSLFFGSLTFGFAPGLFMNAYMAQSDDFPRNLPTIVFTAGENEDGYVKAKAVREWVVKENARRTEAKPAKPPIQSIACWHAMHELDNETREYGGVDVRRRATQFALEVVGEKPPTSALSPGVCVDLTPKIHPASSQLSQW